MKKTDFRAEIICGLTRGEDWQIRIFCARVLAKAQEWRELIVAADITARQNTYLHRQCSDGAEDATDYVIGEITELLEKNKVRVKKVFVRLLENGTEREKLAALRTLWEMSFMEAEELVRSFIGRRADESEKIARYVRGRIRYVRNPDNWGSFDMLACRWLAYYVEQSENK